MTTWFKQVIDGLREEASDTMSLISRRLNVFCEWAEPDPGFVIGTILLGFVLPALMALEKHFG